MGEFQFLKSSGFLPSYVGYYTVINAVDSLSYSEILIECLPYSSAFLDALGRNGWLVDGNSDLQFLGSM